MCMELCLARERVLKYKFLKFIDRDRSEGTKRAITENISKMGDSVGIIKG
jgi:hypothetical protein